jgi:Putative lumazine-binding
MKTLFTLSLLIFSITSFAQIEEASIKATINQLFEGMRKTDSTLLKETLGPSCFLKSVFKTKTGEIKLQEDAMQKWITSVGTKHTGIYDERLTAYDIKIDGEMAVAWTPYEFYISDKFSHCGVDVFTLMKTEKGWKIIGIVDTRRKEGCVK